MYMNISRRTLPRLKGEKRKKKKKYLISKNGKKPRALPAGLSILGEKQNQAASCGLNYNLKMLAYIGWSGGIYKSGQIGVFIIPWLKLTLA